jgi:hypothetical protein
MWLVFVGAIAAALLTIAALLLLAGSFDRHRTGSFTEARHRDLAPVIGAATNTVASGGLGCLGAGFGLFLGAAGFAKLMGLLDERFRPYPTDMPMWIWNFIPGGILGAATGYCMALVLAKRFNKAGNWSLIFGAATMVLSIPGFMNSLEETDPLMSMYFFSQILPFQIWSLLFLLSGIAILILRRWSKAPR